MVSAVTPGQLAPLAPNAGASQAGSTSAEARRREATERAASPSDSVDVRPASWSAARDSVRQALADIDLSLAAGREAAALLSRITDIARAGDNASLHSLLGQLDELVASAISAGAAALTGAVVRAEAEPDAPAFEVAGVDLRLAETEEEGRLRRDASADDASADAAQDTLAQLDAALARLSAASARLQAHEGFLATLQTNVASGVRTDLDADAARLLALNVRQGLAQSDTAIANAGAAESVLSLFRS